MNCRYGLLLGITIYVVSGASADSETISGAKDTLGNGTIESYADYDAQGRPVALGLKFNGQALTGLPPKKNTTSRCYDLDGNGRINDASECEGDFEIRLDLPDQPAGAGFTPFKWVGFNWNPEGHVPPNVYDLPHFDMHFYMVPRDEIDAIRVGGCDLFIHCEDREKALVPVPAKYIHPDHISVGATVSMMGNHLLNSKTPELLNPPHKRKFTHTWIFGSYEGRITFYEAMMTLEYLQGHPN
jgi:hypothetical protein